MPFTVEVSGLAGAETDTSSLLSSILPFLHSHSCIPISGLPLLYSHSRTPTPSSQISTGAQKPPWHSTAHPPAGIPPTLMVSPTTKQENLGYNSQPMESRVSRESLCIVRFWCRDKTWSREASSSLWQHWVFGMQEAEHACCLCKGKAGGGNQPLKSR